MGTIADLIYNQMQTAGKPRTTTQRTTGTTSATENAPLDLGSLGLLLYMMLSGRNKTSIGTTATPAATNLSSIIGSAPGTMQSTPYGSAGQQNPLALLMSLLGNR